jgi:dolichol-phosphate mannosyltransferase
MPQSSQTWSIIIFCFNEVDTVAKVTDKVVQTLQRLTETDFEVLIVDDGSHDGSRDVIRQLEKRHATVRYIFHPENQGIGHALRTGYFNARYENVCAVPADGQFDLDELLVHRVVQPNSFVSFYRKENTTYTFARNALSWANRMVNKFLNGFDLRDVNWVKIYKRERILSLRLEIESSLVESEICAKLMLLGDKVLQVESKYLAREAGQSKGASAKIVKQAMRDTILLFSVLRQFRKQSKHLV